VKEIFLFGEFKQMLSIAKVTIDFFDMLQAAKRNLTYPRYAWIMFGWYPDKWWTGAMARNNLSCSDEQLEVFTENELERY